MKYDKEFKKPDGRRLTTGGPRDLQRQQKDSDRRQSELIRYLKGEIRTLNKELATAGSGEYTGEQVDDEIRNAVAEAVEETRAAAESDREELQVAVTALEKNEKNLLEQVKNLEVYQIGVKDETDRLRLEKDKAISEKKEDEEEIDRLEKELASANQSFKNSETRRSAAEKELKDVAGATDNTEEVDKLTVEITSLNEKLQQSEANKAAAERKLREQDTDATVKILKDDLEHANTQNAKAEKEIEKLRRGIENANRNVKSDLATKTKLEKTIEKLKRDVQRANEKVFEKNDDLEEKLNKAEHARVLLENEEIESGLRKVKDELSESRNKRADLQEELGVLTKKFNERPTKKQEEEIKKLNSSLVGIADEKDKLNALHNKDMKKFQSEIDFLVKENTDAVAKHDKEKTKFKLELEKQKGEVKSFKEKAKQRGVDEEITTLLKEQTKQIEALTSALANAEHQLEIETNRPKMEKTFIDPLEKGAGEDLTSHIEIKEETQVEEKGEIDSKVERLRSLMGKLPSING